MDEKQALTIAQAWRELLMEAAEEGIDARPIYDRMAAAAESYFCNDASLIQLLERHGYMFPSRDAVGCQRKIITDLTNRSDWDVLFPSEYGTDQVIFSFSDKSCLLLGMFPGGHFFGNCTTEQAIYELVGGLASVARHLIRKEAGSGHQSLS